MGQQSSELWMDSIGRCVSVVVADPYPVLVRGVRAFLEDNPQIQVVAEASTLTSLQKRVTAVRPDIALVDWFMASQDLASTARLLRSNPHTMSTIFMTVPGNSPERRDTAEFGAAAFVSKWSSAQKLRSAVLKAYRDAVSLRGGALHRTARGRMASGTDAEQRLNRLTYKERRLLPLVCEGLRNKEIARRLGIAESTLWHHFTSVFDKLEVKDRLELAAFVNRHSMAFRGASRPPTWPGPDSTALAMTVLENSLSSP
jgi:two-component system, NarL family, response regulator DevR